MKLEMEFAIKIMEAMESSDRALIEMGQQILEDTPVNDERYRYHCLMLGKAGLITLWPTKNFQELIEAGFSYIDEDNAIVESMDDAGIHYILAHPMMLTYDGHRFLDVVRPEGTMEKIKSHFVEQGLPFVLSMVKDVGIKIVTG